jgi:flagellar basal body-associated protein FliL
MERDVTQTQGEIAKGGSVNVWIVVIGAIAVTLIMGYFVWSYERQVDEWQAAAAAWRLADVSSGVAIQVSGESLTIDEFAAFLQSTTPEVAALANGEWEVKVAEGLVTTIRSVAA